MSLFLSSEEKVAIEAARRSKPFCAFYWALVNRVEKRAETPGLINAETTVEWWHCAAEYLTDAAMVHALKPTERVRAWLRAAALDIARRPVDDWIGPPFRPRDGGKPTGNLETAHLSWAIAVVLDLAPEVFSDTEKNEITTALREKGLDLCLHWLDNSRRAYNWRCILLAGLAVPAAVLDDRGAIERAVREFQLCAGFFQQDGSYGESLQYGNYAAQGLMLAREALVRRDASLAPSLPILPYARKVSWDACSYFYSKPLSGWGADQRARSANFNDSAALYRPSGDVLLHIAVHAREHAPAEAGLARWLFDETYSAAHAAGPHDRASFGFVNDFGFLTLALWPRAVEALAPAQAGLAPTMSFENGQIFARDTWPGKTILAVQGSGAPLNASAHAHEDVNSFILVHNRERLLLDPGHSCYRNLIHELECATGSHNACTFIREGSAEPIGQTWRRRGSACLRMIDPKTGRANSPVERGARRLLCTRMDEVSAIASDSASAHGEPLRQCTRLWLLCGVHVLFVIDRIEATRPVRTVWNWVLNNRDGALQLKLFRPDRLVVRRGDAGMKLFHLGGGELGEVVHGYVHDAYHPLPGQPGEGRPGSGEIVRWTEPTPTLTRTVVHAIALDTPGMIAHWHLRGGAGDLSLCGLDDGPAWRLRHDADGERFELSDARTGKKYVVSARTEGWALTKEN